MILGDAATGWKYGSDILSAFWEDYFDCVVLGQALIVAVHEVNFESMLVFIFHILEEMELSWHVVALIPVGFPLTEDWEPWFNLEENMVIVSLCVRWTNISNVVIVIESMNVLRKVQCQWADSVGTVGWVDMRHVVNSGELSIDTSSEVEQVKVLINRDRSPMRDVDVPGCLCKWWQWIWESKEKLNLLECCWGDISVRTVN